MCPNKWDGSESHPYLGTSRRSGASHPMTTAVRNQETVLRQTSRAGQTSPFLHAYAVFVAVSILVLICSGGLVTSKGAGLTVPDWPTSYGYNMFAFPVSRWVGGVLYEHSHRLIASTVGMLTLVLTAWIFVADRRKWMKVLGVAASVAVTIQGILGGLRVVELWDWMGIFHACLAQAFLALVSFIALATSRWWFGTLGAPEDRRADARQATRRAGQGAARRGAPDFSATRPRRDDAPRARRSFHPRFPEGVRPLVAADSPG